jgi:hypothetical protein
MQEGKLLGHIVSYDGVNIDPSRVEYINNLTLPISKNEIHYFLGKINFLRRFISNFVELVKLIISMLRKDSEVKWISDSRKYFELINKSLIYTLVLISPKFSKEFLIFYFASDDTLAIFLLQKN